MSSPLRQRTGSRRLAQETKPQDDPQAEPAKPLHHGGGPPDAQLLELPGPRRSARNRSEPGDEEPPPQPPPGEKNQQQKQNRRRQAGTVKKDQEHKQQQKKQKKEAAAESNMQVEAESEQAKENVKPEGNMEVDDVEKGGNHGGVNLVQEGKEEDEGQEEEEERSKRTEEGKELPAKRPRGNAPAAAPAPAPAAAAAATKRPRNGAGGSKSAGKAANGKAANSRSGPTQDMETQLRAQGYLAVGGADEAGRGPLAGPVVAAVVVLPPRSDPGLMGVGAEGDAPWQPPPGLNDSKAMSEEEREAVYEQLTTDPRVKWAVSVVEHEEIDRINILQAALGAMRESAVKLLQQKQQQGQQQQQQQDAGSAAADPPSAPPPSPALDFLLVDGNRLPKDLPVPGRAVVKGDATVSCIAAASCIAKVTRDRLMMKLDEQYPQYGFAQHKGYGVPAHMEAIRKYGPSAVHRRSFEPVKSMTGWTREAALAATGAAAAATTGLVQANKRGKRQGKQSKKAKEEEEEEDDREVTKPEEDRGEEEEGDPKQDIATGAAGVGRTGAIQGAAGNRRGVQGRAEGLGRGSGGGKAGEGAASGGAPRGRRGRVAADEAEKGDEMEPQPEEWEGEGEEGEQPQRRKRVTAAAAAMGAQKAPAAGLGDEGSIAVDFHPATGGAVRPQEKSLNGFRA
ncbi:hypothetical protein VOLCADRAFT_87765 [Volvox carteri f. nagariensis]|uniref:Ribonuclease n=1 Tax=Volvox carteri f. nagariensis TaxID=3068 RepID=D8TM67_VOLCA|nr:uncharacterized protein VOLCADRAFT_87765 [Volvox carteri f. nagariensis]EFJ51591.1 hypothetical protein VOLCADRAFT_87765 [Volvox carteri f. nagariensis]|eukprot:XP_002947543.1 hypothetical protein VOLCADRAFT_87765 [Volvox carteri f. nagariensis]